MAERGDNSDHSGYGDTEMKDCKGNVCHTPTIRDSSFEDHRVSFPSLIIKAEHILSSSKRDKRLASGGLQQISPWLLKRAFLEDTTLECAIIAGQVATRWGRGDFAEVLGELVAESQLIALYKDGKKKDVRAISVRCALRRLLTRAYCA